MKKSNKRVQIALNLAVLNVAELVSFALGIVKGFTKDPDATAPPVKISDLKILADTLGASENNRLVHKAKSFTASEQGQCDALVSAIISVKNYVEDVANKKAKGDETIAVQIITRIGFSVKKKASKHPRSFEVMEVSKQVAHLRIKALAIKEAVIWRFCESGITPPVWSFPIVTLESEVTITGLKSGVNYGFQYAIVLPGKQPVQAGSEQPVWSDIIFSVVL